jgi:hypothetical protein
MVCSVYLVGAWFANAVLMHTILCRPDLFPIRLDYAISVQAASSVYHSSTIHSTISASLVRKTSECSVSLGRAWHGSTNMINPCHRQGFIHSLINAIISELDVKGLAPAKVLIY